MKKILVGLLRRVAVVLNKILLFIEKCEKGYGNKKKPKFEHLAPTDQADEENIYSEAILYALNEDNIFNIALTGPYGSGKSSIIRSFLKKNPIATLSISLAAFVPESSCSEGNGNFKASRQEIERSILQQMLYGADANKLPLSRFKRIKTPGFWSFLKSFYITTGIIAVGYLYTQRESIFSEVFLKPLVFDSWIDYGVLLYAATFFWIVLHNFYVASFGLSLKSVSLKDIEIKPSNEDESSILNRHIDEIIYFFQSTKYKLVVIEDLDRFEDPEIFVTLREINSLVNKNSGVNRRIKFLYALRDDVFISAERTKFFEFIIPVIPIVSSSNSIDMMLEQGKRFELDKRVEMQFLREVSRYLNDLRLIRNIFNEYAIYSKKLEKSLDTNKLLAVLIYKNVYPRDFEELHRGSGNLAKVLNLRDELIKDGETSHRKEIRDLEKQLDIAEQQVSLNLKELRRIYAMIIFENLPVQNAAMKISHDRQNFISIAELSAYDDFEEIITANQLYTQNPYQNGRQAVDFSRLQSDRGLGNEYQQRRVEVENKSNENKRKYIEDISKLKTKISELRKLKLKELLRIDASKTEEVFANFEKDGELARFLVLEGYLDDNYYQYTSLFHSGRLSPNDNKFLIKIRAFITPDPTFDLDNVNEIIAAMRAEDFEQSYVLNIKLVDALLLNKNRYPAQHKSLFEYLSTNFNDCGDFFEAYYEAGSDISGLLSGLVNAWDGLLVKALESPNSVLHITQLIKNLPESLLRTITDKSNALRKVVSDNLPEILARSPELSSQRLVLLKVEVKDLTEIREYSDIVRTMYKESLFSLTIKNIEYAYQAILGGSRLENLRVKNYTVIQSLANSNSDTILIDKIESDFEFYMRNILLKLEDNKREDVVAIVDIVSRIDLEDSLVSTFVDRQVEKIPFLDDIPENRYGMLFSRNTVEPTWQNCLIFMKSESFDKDILVEYLDLKDVVNSIFKDPIPSDDEFFVLREFLLEAGGLSDENYRKYIHALPGSFKSFPDGIDLTKIKALIDEGKIIFTQSSIEELMDKSELLLYFLEKNIEKYLEEPNEFILDDSFLEELLLKGINNRNKLRLIELMDLEVLDDYPSRAEIIGKILEGNSTALTGLGENAIKSLVVYSKPEKIQISLLNKYQEYIDDDSVLEILSSLQSPYSKINYGTQKPILENTKENKDLATWLESRRIISSWRPPKKSTDPVRIYLFQSKQ